MMLRTMLAGGLSAAVLLGPLATTAPAVAEEEDPLQISSAKLVKDKIVVSGSYRCDQPFKARFIETDAQQFQGEDEETEVTGFKTLWDRPCTGAKRRFQVTLAASKGEKFVSAAKGGSNVFVQVQVTVTDENNMYEDQFGDAIDVEV